MQVFEHVSYGHQYAQVQFNALLQDQKGFLWFGTNDGLIRYDGYEFKSYKRMQGINYSLSNNFVTSLCEDHLGRIWVGTADGLHVYLRDEDRFMRIGPQAELTKGLSNNFIRCLYETYNFELIVGTESGLNVAKTDSLHLMHFTQYYPEQSNPSSISHERIRCIAQSRDSSLWIGTWGGGVNKVIRRSIGWEFEKLSLPGNEEEEYFADRIWTLTASDSSLWIGTDGAGLIEFGIEEAQFWHYKKSLGHAGCIPSDIVTVSYVDKASKLWVGTDGGGLCQFNSINKTFTCYQQSSFDPNSLNSNVILSLFEDRQGIFWIGTYRGLNKYNKWMNLFGHQKHIPDDINSLQHNEVSSFLEDSSVDGHFLWIGTLGGGIDRMDLNSGDYQNYSKYSNESSLPDNVVRHIAQDRNGNLWIAWYKKGFSKAKLLTGNEGMAFKNYQYNIADPQTVAFSFAIHILEDSDGYIWISTSGYGLIKHIPKTGKFEYFRHDPDDPNSLSNDILTFAYEDQSGRLWIGTWGGGLNLMDKNSGSFVSYQADPMEDHAISDNHVFCILEEGDHFWVGTGNGLNYFDLRKDTFQKFYDEEGLINNTIYGILKDGKGNLWMSTQNGLSKYNPLNEQFKNFSGADGLQGNEFAQNAFLKLRSGAMAFGGNNGFNLFHPDSIKDNPYPPGIVITHMEIRNQRLQIGESINGDKILDKVISETEEIRLSHKNNSFLLELAALHYGAPTMNSYKVKLEGFDDDWQYLGTRRTINYTNLPPNKYVFKATAASKDGVWNDEPISLIINIQPAFWKTWWFRTFILVLTVLILFALYQSRITVMRDWNKKLEDEIEDHTANMRIKSKELQSRATQLHEANTLLQIRSKQLEEQSEKLEEVNALKDKLFSLIAHDLRNPLFAQRGFLEILYNNYDDYDGATQKDMLLSILESANNVYALLENLLNWARAQRDSIRFEPTEIVLQNLLRENCAANRLLANKKQVSFKEEFSDEEIRVKADPDMIDLVIRNLLSNAIKFSFPGGEIIISCKQEENQAIISIQDFGLGMSEERLRTILSQDKYDSLPGTNHEQGTGLGMVISREFIKRHKGQLHAISEVNKGSTFYIELPLQL